jgi:redox-sensing transcriptional repressor
MPNRLIPEPTLRRLPRYHHYLADLRAQGVKAVSCTTIGEAIHLQPVQVRKDLQLTGIVGKPKVGYDLEELLAAIESFLGWNNVNDAFLVGAGDLGSALLGYEKFSKLGLSIVAAFDANPAKVGRKIHGKLVLPMHKLPDLVRRMAIHIGIITTPAEGAQQVADLLVEGGVRAIWNFAPTTLRVPKDVIVHNEDLYYSLATLSCKLSTALKATGDSETHGTYDSTLPERGEVREGVRDSSPTSETASPSDPDTPGNPE